MKTKTHERQGAPARNRREMAPGLESVDGPGLEGRTSPREPWRQALGRIARTGRLSLPLKVNR